MKIDLATHALAGNECLSPQSESRHYLAWLNRNGHNATVLRVLVRLERASSGPDATRTRLQWINLLQKQPYRERNVGLQPDFPATYRVQPKIRRTRQGATP